MWNLKKFFFLISLFMACNIALLGQGYIGIIAGGNTSATTNIGNAGAGLTGITIGGFLGADRNEKRSSIFELSLRTQGFSNNGKVRLYYANIAGIKTFQVIPNNNNFRLLAGLQPTLFLGKTEPETPNMSYPIYCSGNECFRSPRPLNIDMLAGFEYWGKLRYSGRVGFSLFSNERFKHLYLELLFGI